MCINPFHTRPGMVAAAAVGVVAGVLAAAPALVWLAARAVRAEDRAGRDPLTGIDHRHTARARFTRSATAQDLLLIDLDGFKDVNDTLGHQASDQVIQAVASRLDLWARTHGALAARLGGDEFLIIARHTSAAAARATAKTLHDLIAEPAFVTGTQEPVLLPLSASIGISLPGHGRGWSARLRAADIALYHAKRSQSKICVYVAGMTMPATPPGVRMRDLPIDPPDRDD